MGDAPKEIKVRHIGNCLKADPAYGEGVAAALGVEIDRRMRVVDGVPRTTKRGRHTVTGKRRFDLEEARALGTSVGIDWSEFDAEQFRRGLEVELEHGAA